MVRQVCRMCSKIYEGHRIGYCDECYEKNMKDHKLILDYLKNNPDAIVLEIIEETGVSLRTLNRFVEEGGLNYGESKVTPEDIESGEYLNIIARILSSRGKFHLMKKLG